MSAKVHPGGLLVRPDRSLLIQRHSSEPPPAGQFLHQTGHVTFQYSSIQPPRRQIVVILGGSYSGAHCAHKLAELLPPTATLILIERSSHMIHRFVLPRYTTYPAHEHKAFIPYSSLLLNNTFPQYNHHNTTRCESRIIQASAVKISNSYIEFDQPVKGFGTRVPYNFLVYALGAELPGFLGGIVDSDKVASSTWLKNLQTYILEAERIVVVGGGALGIQFSSDIKERYPEKKVTIIHSRDRFLPLYDFRLHELILEKLQSLGVECIFSSRVTSPLAVAPNTATTVTTDNGLSIPCDLQIVCTGLRYNSRLIAELSPQSLNNKRNTLHVLPTMQLADSRFPNIFAIGDVADTAALKNAVNGWYQGETVARNITTLVRRAEENQIHESGILHPSTFSNDQSVTGDSDDAFDGLDTYIPSPPIIKVTVGAHTYVIQQPDPDNPLLTKVEEHEAKEDLDAAVMWKMYGADPEDLFA